MKTKNRALLVSVLLIVILLFNVNSGYSRAIDSSIGTSSDADKDGIDDNFEKLNERKVEIEYTANEATIVSSGLSNDKKDQITIEIALSEEGILFQTSYKPNPESECKLTYGIIFYALIEFVDIDFDGNYNPEIDQYIQNLTLGEFSPIFYEKTVIKGERYLHKLGISTDNKNFSLEVYIAEEFTLIDNFLITPTQARVMVEIANFKYVNGSSQLALYTRLDPEGDYLEQEKTEDEENGYASNEAGITTTMNDFTGFFTWNESAIVDDKLKNVVTGEILPDEYMENGKKLYISYNRGFLIRHYTKIGIEDLLITEEFPFLSVFFLVLAIGAASSIVVYSYYHKKKSKLPMKTDNRYREEKPITVVQNDGTSELFDNKLALQILEGECAIEKLYSKGDINITAISEDFYETIESFGLKRSERAEFIREMLSLPPIERELILREMIIKSQ
ncbi:MAG: hypothetical protein ACFE96_13725 [Candidatus Hermodarchaeota archaeon]